MENTIRRLNNAKAIRSKLFFSDGQEEREADFLSIATSQMIILIMYSLG